MRIRGDKTHDRAYSVLSILFFLRKFPLWGLDLKLKWITRQITVDVRAIFWLLTKQVNSIDKKNTAQSPWIMLPGACIRLLVELDPQNINPPARLLTNR
jgi:hypothetical protein